MRKIGVPNMSYLPYNNRIRNLYDEFCILLSSKYEIVIMPLFNVRMTETERDQLTRKFIDEIDVFVGYDRRFMRVRYSHNYKPKVILPMFADMTRGGITLWLNKRYFIKSDILMFSSFADREIFEAAIVESEINSIVVPLPLASSFKNNKPIRTRRMCNENIKILYVGRLTREKNIHNVIEFCSQLKMNVSLTIVGEWFDHLDGGKYRQEVIELIDKNNMSERVLFTGYLCGSELIDAYRTADVFITFSTNPDENFGLAIVEALSQGLPILCTDWGGFKDHVIDGWNGYKIKTELCNQEVRMNVSEALEIWAKMCSPEVMVTMSEHSIKLYESKYQHSVIFEMMNKALLSNYDEAEAILKFNTESSQYCTKYMINHIKKKRGPDEYFGQEYYVSSLKGSG